MALPPLPTPWNVFNLHASPYGQESLGESDEVHPLSLFVGRLALPRQGTGATEYVLSGTSRLIFG